MKSIKFICMLAVMGLVTLGLSGVSLADAPAADGPKVVKAYKGQGINYPAYLYARGARGERDYKKLVKPAKGYDFNLYFLAARHFVPADY